MLLLIACGCVLLAAGASQAIAQAFPTKPVRIVAPFAAGGGGDLNARRLADRLARAWGQPVVVQNVTGAAGNTAAALVAGAMPDGYTLLFASHPILAANSWLYGKLPFDAARDFAAVVYVSETPHVFLVNPSVPAASVSELVALAKNRPGNLNFGSGGPGTSTHLAAELLMSTAGIALTHVPYKGAAPAVAALMGGEVQVLFDSSTTAIGHVRGGRVRGLAVASSGRLVALPELPTFAESGLAGFTAGVSHGIVAPARTPATTLRTLNRDINRALQDDEYRKYMVAAGVNVVGGLPEDFRAFLAAERKNLGEVIRRRGIKAN
ncbi:MAG TPA: tripartite tricarboxylate transporter substrate-binding protein [Opitutaceae bacterium]